MSSLHVAKTTKTIPEAPCDASSVRAVEELAPSWLLSESAIFSCRRASAAPRLPRPEPRRLTNTKETLEFYFCFDCDTIIPYIFPILGEYGALQQYI